MILTNKDQMISPHPIHRIIHGSGGYSRVACLLVLSVLAMIVVYLNKGEGGQQAEPPHCWAIHKWVLPHLHSAAEVPIPSAAHPYDTT